MPPLVLILRGCSRFRVALGDGSALASAQLLCILCEPRHGARGPRFRHAARGISPCFFFSPSFFPALNFALTTCPEKKEVFKERKKGKRNLESLLQQRAFPLPSSFPSVSLPVESRCSPAGTLRSRSAREGVPASRRVAAEERRGRIAGLLFLLLPPGRILSPLFVSSIFVRTLPPRAPLISSPSHILRRDTTAALT